MVTGDLYEAVVLLARLGFAALLYFFLGVALWVMWRDLRRRVAPAAPPGRLAPSAPSARLTLASAPPGDGAPGRSVPVRDGLVIGRRRPSDIVVEDDFVSGQHARLRFTEGRWCLEDLGSTNGTYVNGQRVDGPIPLSHADKIAMGQATWRFEIGE